MATKEALVVQDAGAGELGIVSRDAGVMALAMMGEHEFEARLAAMKLGQDRIRRIQRELMVGPSPDNPEGEDYGVIPGTKKPTLLKPGAEKICNVYGLVPVFEEHWIEGDGVSTPHLRVRIKCRLHRGEAEGPVAGEGWGAANSWEKKHRYRAAQRSCPACGCDGTIKRSTFERDGDKGWYCHAKIGGCGANFRSDDTSITEQQGGQVDNPDPYDTENTLLKMASKRAQVDATLRVTATSGLFTQDVEDQSGDHGGGGVAGEGGRGAQQPPPAASSPATAAPPSRQASPAPASRAPSGPGHGAKPTTCPRCHKTGTIIKNNYKAGEFVCWKNAKPVAGCGYSFAPDDVEIHDNAARERQASGQAFDEREPGRDDAD